MVEEMAQKKQDDWKTLLVDILRRMPAYLRLGRDLAASRELKGNQKIRLLTGVVYSLSPVDLVPGFIPLFGQLDDLAVLLWGLRSALRECSPETAALLLQSNGLTEDQLDQDLRSLGLIAKQLGFKLGRGIWKVSLVVGSTAVKGIISGIRALRK